MHGKNLRAYSKEGEIRDDSDFIRIRSELERLMVQEMREEGYLPVQDVKIMWSTKRIDSKYEFALTMYAAYAGKRKAREWDFWSEGQLVKNG